MHLLKTLSSCWRGFVAFHRNERGDSSSISNVMILGLAATIVVGVLTFGQTATGAVSDWFEGWFDPEGNQ